MTQRLYAHAPWLVPALIIGLFLGRVSSEAWFLLTARAPGWTGITLLTAVSLPAGALLAKRNTAVRLPALLLLGYLFYPHLHLPAALFFAAACLTAVLLYSSQNASASLPAAWTGPLLAGSGFLLYTLTLAPDLLSADSGEFQLVAARLGVAHPPGFPLYTLLAHAFTRLPIPAAPALKVNLFSAAAAAATLWVTYQIVWRLTQQRLAGATAVLALATSTTFWAQATTANIRSLTALFAALMFYTMVGLGDGGRGSGVGDRGSGAQDRWLTGFALAAGFGVGHHPSLLFISLVCLVFMALTAPDLVRRPRRWIRPLAAALLGLLPLLYLPLRAHSGAPGATPGLATLNGFLNHVLARGFSGDFFYFTDPPLLWERLRVMGNVMTFQFSGWLLAGMVIGLALLARRAPKMALLLGGSFALHTLVTATYRAPQTVEYMLPAYLPAVIGLGYGLGALRQTAAAPLLGPVSDRARLGRMAAPLAQLAAALLFVLSVAQGVRHAPSYFWLRQHNDTRDFANTLLQGAPPDAVILADWHWFSPLRYVQQVDGQRPDVAVHFVPPGEGRYAETWAERIAAELAHGRSVIVTHFEENAYAALPPPQPLGEAYLFPQEPLDALPEPFQTQNEPLQTADLLGVHVISPVAALDDEVVVTIAWQAVGDAPVSLYAHLVGFDGRLYAQDDVKVRSQPEGMTLTRFRLTPRPGAAPGDYALYIGQGAARAEVDTITLTPAQTPPVTLNAVQRPLASDPARRLVGFDWDQTLPDQTRLYLHWRDAGGHQTQALDNPDPAALPLPPTIGPWGLVRDAWRLSPPQAAHYVPLAQGVVWSGGGLPAATFSPGETVRIAPTLHSRRPLLRDLVVSVRLVGYEGDSDLWAWTDQNDSVPAMGAIPTLKWIGGSTVRSPHFVAVSPLAAPGQRLGATMRLYDAFTNRPLAILDERITAVYPWVPLGEATVSREP